MHIVFTYLSQFLTLFVILSLPPKAHSKPITNKYRNYGTFRNLHRFLYDE